MLVPLAMRSSASFHALSSVTLLAGNTDYGPLVDSITGIAPGYGVSIALQWILSEGSRVSNPVGSRDDTGLGRCRCDSLA